jgi:hypothetical protein
VLQTSIAKIQAEIDAGDFTQAGELAPLQAQIDQANTAAALEAQILNRA